MTRSPGRQVARTPSASVALTPSTTQGGHPGWRGASVATTMASSGRCRRGAFTCGARPGGRQGCLPSVCACRREISSALLLSCRPDRHLPRSTRHPVPSLSSQFGDALPKRASRIGASGIRRAQSLSQTRPGQFRELVAPIPSGHQAQLRCRRANTIPHDSPQHRTLSGSVPRSKMMQSRSRQWRTIGPAFHRAEPKTSGADQRLSLRHQRITSHILEPSGSR